MARHNIMVRLREPSGQFGKSQILCNEAADEIWNLREILRDIRLLDNSGQFKQWDGQPWLKRVRNIDLES